MYNVQWLTNAGCVEAVYGTHVDYNDGFYICPECGEPIYEKDWAEIELEKSICPICKWGED